MCRTTCACGRDYGETARYLIANLAASIDRCTEIGVVFDDATLDTRRMVEPFLGLLPQRFNGQVGWCPECNTQIKIKDWRDSDDDNAAQLVGSCGHIFGIVAFLSNTPKQGGKTNNGERSENHNHALK